MDNESKNCLICNDEKEFSEILKLHGEHIVCLLCLKVYIYKNLDINIKCPMKDCNIRLKDDEIRCVLNESDIKQFEVMNVDALDSSYTCILPECGNQVIFENVNIQYECENCTLFNCIACKASHPLMSCKDFKKLDKDQANKISETELSRVQNIFLKKMRDESRKSLLEMNKIDLFPNPEIFECFLCCMIIAKGQGAQLRNCFHFICRTCLQNYLKTIDKIPPKCPNAYCDFIIEDREIKEILSENDYEIYNQKLINRFKRILENHYKCQTPDCTYICEITDAKRKTLKCPNCKQVNCLSCRTVHNNESCANHRKRLSSTDFGANLRAIEEKIKKKECMICPDCSSLLQKVRGCNWIQCSTCGVELCWILQMHRWGPKGRNDISGGCKCMVNDIPCHKDCRGCIPHNEGPECSIM